MNLVSLRVFAERIADGVIGFRYEKVSLYINFYNDMQRFEMKTIFRRVSLLVCGAVLCTACGDKDDGAVTPSISIQTKSVALPETKDAQQTVDFKASVDWTVTVNGDGAAAWCAVSPKQGAAGNASVVIATTAANETYDNRTAEVVISAGTASEKITVTQKKKGALILTDNRYEVQGKGETIEVKLQSNVTYRVVIPETDREWVTRVASKGLSSDVLRFAVKAHAGGKKIGRAHV